MNFIADLYSSAAFVAAVLAGASPAEAQSFQNVVETFYGDEFRTHPIAATDIGVHDYDAGVDDLSRDGQAKNIARLHRALDAFIAIDPANLSAGERDDREMLINSRKGKLQDIETVRYWQKDSSRRWPIAAVSHRRRRQERQSLGNRSSPRRRRKRWIPRIRA